MFRCEYNRNRNRDQNNLAKDDLAIIEDGVYISFPASSKDDKANESETTSIEVQNGADTTPHSLRGMAVAAAPDSQALKSTIASVAVELNFVVRGYYKSFSSTGHIGRRDWTDFAALCAQIVAAALHGPIYDLTFTDRRDVVDRVAPCDPVDPDGFWTVLNGMLFNYLWQFNEPEWSPLPSIGGTVDHAPSMPVWEQPDGSVVCDVLTAWGSEDALEMLMGAAIGLALSVFGRRLAAVRLTPPLGFYMARWYYPDGSWSPVFDIPEFEVPEF